MSILCLIAKSSAVIFPMPNSTPYIYHAIDIKEYFSDISDQRSGKTASSAGQARDFFTQGIEMNSVPNIAHPFAQVPAAPAVYSPRMLRPLKREHCMVRRGFSAVAEELLPVAELAVELRARHANKFKYAAA